MDNQLDTWEKYTEKISVEDIISNVRQPAIFQQELSDLLNHLIIASRNPDRTLI